MKNKLWKVCACSTKTLCFHGIQESAHLVFFTWLLLYSISDWFSGTLFTRVMHSPFFSFLIKTAAMYGLLIPFWLLYSRFGSSWHFQSARAWFTKQAHKPYHYFHLSTALTWTTICHIYCAKFTHMRRIRSHDQIWSIYGRWLMKLQLQQFFEPKKPQRGFLSTLCLFQCVTWGI